jgi:hypothetical protein
MKEVTKEGGGFTALKLNGHQKFEISTTSMKERGKEICKQAHMVRSGQLTSDTCIFGMSVTGACVTWLSSQYKLSFLK